MKFAWITALTLVAAPAVSQECPSELRQRIAEAAAFRVKQTSIIAFLDYIERDISFYQSIVDDLHTIAVEASQQQFLDALILAMQVQLDTMRIAEREFSGTEFASSELPAWIIALGLAFQSDTAAARQCTPEHRASIARAAFDVAEREIATELAALTEAYISHLQAVIEGMNELNVVADHQRLFDAVSLAMRSSLDNQRSAHRELGAIVEGTP